MLWDSINVKKHIWDSNPFVWVIEFEVINKNISEVEKIVGLVKTETEHLDIPRFLRRQDD